DISEIVRTHKRLTGAPGSPLPVGEGLGEGAAIVEDYSTPRQKQLLVRTDGPLSDLTWEVADVSLEEIVLAYLGQSSGTATAHADVATEMEVSQ
ncbi:MAG TPA: hypothetical protein VFW76_13785, partial [Ktedonobacterales bacterium]|nr:hypothetical protein [Ktedonobacterales bacterium]